MPTTKSTPAPKPATKPAPKKATRVVHEQHELEPLFDSVEKKLQFENAVHEFMINRKLMEQKEVLKKPATHPVLFTKYGYYYRVHMGTIADFLNEAYDQLGIEDANEFSDWVQEAQQYVFDVVVEEEQEVERVKCLKFLRMLNTLMINVFDEISTSLGDELTKARD